MIDFFNRLIGRTRPSDAAVRDVERTFTSLEIDPRDKPACAQKQLDEYFEHKREPRWLLRGRKLMDMALAKESSAFRSFFVSDALVPVLSCRVKRFRDAEEMVQSQHHVDHAATAAVAKFRQVLGEQDFAALQTTVRAIVLETQEQHDLALLYAQQMSEAALHQAAAFFGDAGRQALVERVGNLLVTCEQVIKDSAVLEPLRADERDRADAAHDMLAVAEPDGLRRFGSTPENLLTLLTIVGRGFTDAELVCLREFFASQAGQEYVHAKFIGEGHLDRRRAGTKMQERALQAALQALTPATVIHAGIPATVQIKAA